LEEKNMKFALNRLFSSASSEIELLKSLNRHYDITRDSWRVLRIQSEVIDGFENLKDVRTAVSIFGSARTPEDDPYYKKAEILAHKLAQNGISVISGGGPGIMTAANKGAQKSGKALSIGLNIELPFEQAPNPHQDIALEFRYFFVRKLMFVRYSTAFIFFPGGFGTLDELGDVICLIQTKKIENIPVILFGKKFWKGMIDWFDKSMMNGKFINEEDIHRLVITDNMDEVISVIKDYIDKNEIKE
jgi:uncharacterized protein (TIGR00730 family)